MSDLLSYLNMYGGAGRRRRRRKAGTTKRKTTRKTRAPVRRRRGRGLVGGCGSCPMSGSALAGMYSQGPTVEDINRYYMNQAMRGGGGDDKPKRRRKKRTTRRKSSGGRNMTRLADGSLVTNTYFKTLQKLFPGCEKIIYDSKGNPKCAVQGSELYDEVEDIQRIKKLADDQYKRKKKNDKRKAEADSAKVYYELLHDKLGDYVPGPDQVLASIYSEKKNRG